MDENQIAKNKPKFIRLLSTLGRFPELFHIQKYPIIDSRTILWNLLPTQWLIAPNTFIAFPNLSNIFFFEPFQT